MQLGIGILTTAGLDPDDFDIPGRAGRPKAKATAWPSSTPPRAPDIDPADAARRFEEAVDRAFKDVGARDGETLYAAQRRNFDAAAADARQRDERRRIAAAAHNAADMLWEAGIRCYLVDKEAMIWAIETDSGLHEAGQALMIEVGRMVVEMGADAVLDTLRAAA